MINSVPKISVIMPVYNAEKYIDQTIDSVLNQSFENFELIIINDGSSDASHDIIKTYADDRIKYYTNAHNSGIVFSLNKAIGIAAAEYIARIDADDICYKDRLQLQFDFLESNIKVGVCSGDIALIDSNNRDLGITRLPRSSEDCNMKFLFGNPIIHPASMFRKSLALKVGGYTVGMEPAEDLDFWLKLSEISEIENIDKVLIKYRIHENSYSKVKRNEYNEKLKKILNTESKLKINRLIDDKFLNYHIRLIIGTWNEKSSVYEASNLKNWKKSVLRNNIELTAFNNKKLEKELNFNINLILLSLIKSKQNSILVKLISSYNLLFFNPFNILQILKLKK